MSARSEKSRSKNRGRDWEAERRQREANTFLLDTADVAMMKSTDRQVMTIEVVGVGARLCTNINEPLGRRCAFTYAYAKNHSESIGSSPFSAFEVVEMQPEARKLVVKLSASATVVQLQKPAGRLLAEIPREEIEVAATSLNSSRDHGWRRRSYWD